VAGLCWNHLLGREGPASPSQEAYCRDVFLRSPGAGPRFPSLVCEEPGGAIVGFFGVVARTLRYGDREVHAAYGGSFVVRGDLRHRGIGSELMRALLSGNQDLSLVDSANLSTLKLWQRLGGSVVYPQSIQWARPLRLSPYAALALSGLRRCQGPGVLPWIARTGARGAYAVAARVPRPFRSRQARAPATDLDVDALHACQVELSGDEALCHVPDRASLQWVLEFIARNNPQGVLRMRRVGGGDASPGWFVCFVRPRGIAHVLQIAARPDSIRTVLQSLFADAWDAGAIAVHGRMEPAFAPVLGEEGCFFHTRGPWELVHSRQPELEQRVLGGQSRLSRLSGEWCLGQGTL
jgi:GNAT superfamily N-acetyltransferase